MGESGCDINRGEEGEEEDSRRTSLEEERQSLWHAICDRDRGGTLSNCRTVIGCSDLLTLGVPYRSAPIRAMWLIPPTTQVYTQIAH